MGDLHGGAGDVGVEIAALGLDAGSTTTKLVGVDRRGELVWHLLEPTHPRMERQATALLARAREAGAALDCPLVATGYGRNLVGAAHRTITEISCHAKGIFRALGHGGTLVDIGGQDSKVVIIGKRGQVLSFTMNDKCAAGTGRFLEVSAGRLQLSLAELGAVALSAAREVQLSSTCVVFAESEIISLLARGEELEPIVRGLHRALLQRVAALTRSAGLRPPLMLSGGVARNPAVPVLLGEALGLPVELPPLPQLMGAYGAALAAL